MQIGQEVQFSKDETGRFRFAARKVILDYEGNAKRLTFGASFLVRFLLAQKMNIKINTHKKTARRRFF